MEELTLSTRDLPTESYYWVTLQEVSDLQEQLADLMRHLETQQAIASAPDETRQVGRCLLVCCCSRATNQATDT